MESAHVPCIIQRTHVYLYIYLLTLYYKDNIMNKTLYCFAKAKKVFDIIHYNLNNYVQGEAWKR